MIAPGLHPATGTGRMGPLPHHFLVCSQQGRSENYPQMTQIYADEYFSLPGLGMFPCPYHIARHFALPGRRPDLQAVSPLTWLLTGMWSCYKHFTLHGILARLHRINIRRGQWYFHPR